MTTALKTLLEILPEPTIPSLAWTKKSASSLLMITSSSCPEMPTSLLPVWSVTGPKAVESSTMMPRPSSSGSMRRIISMQQGGDVKGVFDRLARGIKAVGDCVKGESGKDFMLDAKYGYVHSCPTNLGTGMRASVHCDLPGWTKEGVDKLKARCEELAVQPRGTRGESGGQTGHTYDISNKHRLGYSEVQLVQVMIDGVDVLYKEDLEWQKKHGM